MPKNKKTYRNLAIICFACGFAQPYPALAEAAASLQKLSGVVHVRFAQGGEKLAYEQMDVGVGDVVTTELDSSVMLLFADKGQLALRPESEFLIKAFHYEEAKPAEDNLVISLLKGGLRTITGYVSKRGNRDAYRLESATATMGIRGTDYTARLCEADCEIEQAQYHRIAPSISGIIGRVAELEGGLSRGVDGNYAAINKADALFEHDELHMGAGGYALLVFIDGARLLLQAGGTLKISQYQYDPANRQNDSMVINLITGAARISSGSIAKNSADKARFNTAAATVGLRGASLDLRCGRQQDAECDGELFVKLRQGEANIKAGNQELMLAAGQAAYVAGPDQAPVLTGDLPQAMEDNPYPLPENMPVEMNGEFGLGAQKVAPGLYVTVNEGGVVLTEANSNVVIVKGETGYSPLGGNAPELLSISPAFLNNDDVLLNMPFIQGLCR
ncbi:MAG: FecR domain-containing protein [Methylomonas sp.]